MTIEQKQTAGAAVASLVLGILGLILMGPLGSIPAVICGHVAKSTIKKNPGALSGEGMALAGLIMGYIQIGLMVVMVPLMVAVAIPSFAKARDVAMREKCIQNMRMIDHAKQKARVVHGYKPGDVIPQEQVSEHLEGGVSGIVCPKGGVYEINPAGQDPECSVHGSLSDAIESR